MAWIRTGILAGIMTGILGGIKTGILTGILTGIPTWNLTGTLTGILTGILTYLQTCPSATLSNPHLKRTGLEPNPDPLDDRPVQFHMQFVSSARCSRKTELSGSEA
jgi:LytS/YehU family sensor histidine kinase